MKKLIPFLLLALLLSSCLEQSPAISSSPHIQSFSFPYHEEVPNIENYHFTVDSINCQIYNEDSIEYGANLTRLHPSILFTGSPKTLWINDVEWDKNDSADFSHPVQLKVLSQNGKGEATYNIQLNQHQVNPNEIHWEQLASFNLEGAHEASKVVNFASVYYLFAALDNGTLVVYSSSDLLGWSKISNFDTPIIAHSIVAGSKAIYGLEKGRNAIWRYNTDSKQWEFLVAEEEGTFLDLMGQFGERLLISYQATDGSLGMKAMNINTLVIENQELVEPLPSTFPETGSAKFWADGSLFLIGGTRQNKTLTNLIASKNGSYWTDLFHQPAQFAYPARTMTGVGMYEDILFLIGGKNDSNEILSDLYYSQNYGYSWLPASNDMVLPDSYTPKYGISIIQKDKYVYLIGGEGATLNNEIEIWRGILRKTEFIRPDAINKWH